MCTRGILGGAFGSGALGPVRPKDRPPLRKNEAPFAALTIHNNEHYKYDSAALLYGGAANTRAKQRLECDGIATVARFRQV